MGVSVVGRFLILFVVVLLSIIAMRYVVIKICTLPIMQTVFGYLRVDDVISNYNMFNRLLDNIYSWIIDNGEFLYIGIYGDIGLVISRDAFFTETPTSLNDVKGCYVIEDFGIMRYLNCRELLKKGDYSRIVDLPLFFYRVGSDYILAYIWSSCSDTYSASLYYLDLKYDFLLELVGYSPKPYGAGMKVKYVPGTKPPPPIDIVEIEIFRINLLIPKSKNLDYVNLINTTQIAKAIIESYSDLVMNYRNETSLIDKYIGGLILKGVHDSYVESTKLRELDVDELTNILLKYWKYKKVNIRIDLPQISEKELRKRGLNRTEAKAIIELGHHIRELLRNETFNIYYNNIIIPILNKISNSTISFNLNILNHPWNFKNTRNTPYKENAILSLIHI